MFGHKINSLISISIGIVLIISNANASTNSIGSKTIFVAIAATVDKFFAVLRRRVEVPLWYVCLAVTRRWWKITNSGLRNRFSYNRKEQKVPTECKQMKVLQVDDHIVREKSKR